MRNLAQYPITKEEKLRVLDEAIKEHEAKQLFGGITGPALREIRETIAALD